MVFDAAASAHGAEVISAYRVSQGLKPVAVLATLQAPAVSKADDMATRDYAAHDDPPGAPDAPAGRGWSTRDLAYGYQGAVGEIIAWGTEYVLDANGMATYWILPDGSREPITRPMNPEEALAQWISGGPNEGHYQILHIADYDAIGYAVANDASGEAFHIAVFGIAPAVPVKPPPGPVTPPPTPLPAPPARGSHWRVRVNPFAKPITVTGQDSQGRVLAQNRKGQPLEPMSVDAFLRKYKPV